MIARANREHSTAAAGFLASLRDIRGITERNANGAKETLNRTSGLLLNARRLTEMAETFATAPSAAKAKTQAANGRRARKASHSSAKKRR